MTNAPEIILLFTLQESINVAATENMQIVFFLKEYYMTMLGKYFEYSPLLRLLGITANTNAQTVVLLGIAATITGMLRFIPIVIEINRSKKTNNFTVWTLVLAITSAIMWILYSFFQESTALAISASIALSVYMYIVYMKVKHN